MKIPSGETAISRARGLKRMVSWSSTAGIKDDWSMVVGIGEVQVGGGLCYNSPEAEKQYRATATRRRNR